MIHYMDWNGDNILLNSRIMKPTLNKHINLSDLKNHYWLKSELIAYCKANQLATAGAKEEIMQRIEAFMIDGRRIKPLTIKAATRDSSQPIQLNTLVINYHNDAATREFFIRHTGKYFHFNSYLRQFTNKVNISPDMTYHDLIKGWVKAEATRNKPDYKTSIGKQFEYNQFIKDFFANEKNKSLADAIAAWKVVKTLAGDRTYAMYLEHRVAP